MKVYMDSPNKIQKYKSTHNSAIFWATDSRFFMEIHINCPTKWQSTKVQKYKKVQKFKKRKNDKNQKNVKSTKKNSPAPAISTKKKQNRVKQQKYKN